MPLSRGAGSTLLEALEGHFHPVLLTYADWPGGAVRAHSGGPGDISWDGHTWVGGGSLVQWEAPAEEADLASAEATVHVAGSLANVLAEAGTDIRGVSVRLWFGCTETPSGTTLVGDPVLILAGTFSGRRFALASDGMDATHDLILDVSLGPWARAKAVIRHSYEDQIAAYPGDTAGRYLQNLAKQAANPPQFPEP